MHENIIASISVLAAFNLTLLALVCWFRTKKAPAYFWLGCMFIGAAIGITSNSHIHFGKGVILLYHISLILDLSWGGYLILFVQSLRERNLQKPLFDWKLFIPSMLYIPFVVLCIAEPQWATDTLLLAKQGQMTIFGLIYSLIAILYSIGAAVYLLVIEFSKKHEIQGDSKLNSKIRKEILWFMLALLFMAFTPFLLELDLDYINLYMPIFGQIFFLYIFFRLSHSSVFVLNDLLPVKILDSTEPSVKYAGIRIEDDKIDAICIRMNHLMENEKPFLRLEYNLNEMSKQLGISINILSMIINSKLKTSFPDYINSFRVKRAQQLLLELKERHLTIEAVAYDSGFSNRTSFYKAFKKHTGKLPSEFVKEQNKSKENLLVG